MQKFDTVRFEIVTGASGSSSPPRMRFNGFELELECEAGGTAIGETYRGKFDVASVPHSVELLGPQDGEAWDLSSVRVDYVGPVLTKREFGPLQLAVGEVLDVWTEEAPSFDV